jgi:hypothetical protein
MPLRQLVLVLVLVLVLQMMPDVSDAYSSGAGSCSVPSRHGGGNGAATTSFSAPSSASAGESVTVTLSGSSFTGFIVKASQGTFTGHSTSTMTKAKPCSGFSSAATHRSGSAKSSVSFTLMMPASGSVSIQGQVVSSYSSSHTVASTTISVSSSTPPPPSPPPPPPPPPVVNCAGSWGNWGACSATCGGGRQSRSYTVTTAASGGGASCPASNGATQGRDCNTDACSVNCAGSWGNWGACSATCGGGRQSRSYTVTTAASGGGASCPASNGATQGRVCGEAVCSVQEVSRDCSGSWGNWGACSATCGGGSQTRRFAISAPASGGGELCGSTDGATETQNCNTDACAAEEVATTEPRVAQDETTVQESESEEEQQQLGGTRNRVPIRRGDSLEPRQKKRIGSSLIISADIASIAPGTPARASFESDFRATMSTSLGAVVQPEDIEISSIAAGPTGERSEVPSLCGLAMVNSVVDM